MNTRIIAHLDMDAFFASVEEAATPRFRGKPLVVGSEIINGFGRGVVSTANYKAREYGIRSAMPIMTAWKLSQEAKKQGKEEVIFLPVDFALYHGVSAHVLEIIRSHSAVVEQASVDEFYFDLSFAKSFKKAEAICKKIKAAITKQESVTCSVGIGPNKLISKIAAGFKKPDGLHVVAHKKVQNFLSPLGVRELPGVGPKTAEVLYKKDINLIGDLMKFSKLELKAMLGKLGEALYEKARGIDENPIAEYRQAKSIGEQTTLAANTLEPVVMYETLKKLSDNVFASFVKSEFEAFGAITITIRFADFETKSSSKSFKEGITKHNKHKFDLEVMKLVLPFFDRQSNPKRKPVRLIGVRVEKFNGNVI